MRKRTQILLVLSPLDHDSFWHLCGRCALDRIVLVLLLYSAEVVNITLNIEMRKAVNRINIDSVQNQFNLNRYSKSHAELHHRKHNVPYSAVYEQLRRESYLKK